jgi:hypothetical protein
VIARWQAESTGLPLDFLRAKLRGGAALSHYTAAEVAGLTDRASNVIHVTAGHDQRFQLDQGAAAPSAPGIAPSSA